MWDVLKELINSVLKPLITAILRLPWVLQAAILMLVAGTTVWIKNPEAIENVVYKSDRIVRVIANSDQHPPLAEPQKAWLRQRITELSLALDSRLDKSGNYAGQAWTTAQILIALQGKASIDSQSASAFLNTQMGPACRCWRKYPREDYPMHVGVSSWVVTCMAKLGIAATADQIDFLLQSQSMDGWWPMYPAGISPENASTYATAMSILALHEHLRRGLLGNYEDRVQIAIERGVTWLSGNRLEGKARWRDYPRGTESVAVSAHIIHLMHKLRRSESGDINRLWLQSLPVSVPRAKDAEASNRTIFTPSGVPIHTDDTRYYPLQWTIIGIVDSYRYGSLMEKVAALEWLEQVLQTPGPTEGVVGTREDDWIAAELLDSLRVLAGDEIL